jgi:redox-sensitive bicupin YhaK (pirin superfamily)
MSQSSRKTEHIVQGQPTRDGAGVNLIRVLTQQWQRRLDPFLMLDEFRSDDPNDYIAGFPEHPHRGFETVTYMLAGQMRHKDNAGHEGVVGPGDVQWMTAGKGILHSETPEQVAGLMHGFQLWINLPAKNKLAKPSYAEVPAAQIPVVTTDEGHRVKVVAGQWNDIVGPLQRPDTNPVYLDIQLTSAQPLFVPIPAGHNAFVYVVQGQPHVAGQTIAPRRMAILSNDSQATGVLLQGQAGDQLLVLSGQPLGEPIVQWGPFVMNTRSEIEQAISDYQSGQL